MAVLLIACEGGVTPTSAPPQPTDTPSPTPTSIPVPTATATAIPTPTSTPTPTQSEIAVYEVSECRFDVPRGQTVQCGFLSVPEDRRQTGGPTLRLHVAIFRSHSSNPAPDPIVYLEGGPGGKSLKAVPLIFNRRFAPFLADRDFIMFDQRGVGFSEPALDCPEAIEVVHDTLDQDLSFEETVALSAEAILACRDRLVREGVNLEAFTSAESAADLKDLRRALGYDEWNLYGISYGTRLALTAMRDFPEGIRSVILDSTVPLEVNLYTQLSPDADRAFDVLFNGCAVSPICNAAYPDLGVTFFEVVEQLNKAPVVNSITNPLTGETFDALTTGDDLVEVVFQSLYSTEIIPVLPQIIYDARRGRFGLLALLQGSFLADLEFISHGMHLSVQCGEEIPFTTIEEIAASSEAYPEFQGNFDSTSIFDLCQSWGARRADPVENQPVRSDIPTLVLAGEYDPITPPAWGQLAAENLSNSFYFEFPGVGHGASLGSSCALSVVSAFLDTPGSEPDASCIAGMGGPAFVVRP